MSIAELFLAAIDQCSVSILNVMCEYVYSVNKSVANERDAYDDGDALGPNFKLVTNKQIWHSLHKTYLVA